MCYIMCQVEPKQEILTTTRTVSRQFYYKLQRKQFGLDVDCLGLFEIFQAVKFRQVSAKVLINF